MWIIDNDDILYTLAFVMLMLTIVTNEAVIRQEFHFNHESPIKKEMVMY